MPQAEGELAVIDVVGDDRFSAAGKVIYGWSDDGERILALTTDRILIWRASTGILERQIPLEVRFESPARVIMSPDDRWIAVMGYLPRTSSKSTEMPATFLLQSNGDGAIRRFDAGGLDLSFSSDSLRLVSFKRAWDVETGAAHELPSVPHQLHYLPDEKRAIVLETKGDWPKQTFTPQILDLASGRVLHRFDPINSSIGIALSGNGKRLALVRNDAMTVYSTDDYARIASIEDIEGAMMVALSHDGRRAVLEVLHCTQLASTGSETQSHCPPPVLSIWEVDSAKRILRTPRGSGDQWEFTRDGEYLTGPITRLVEYLIRVRDGAELRFGNRIRAISQDNRRLVYDDTLGSAIAALDEKSPVPAFARLPRVIARSLDGHYSATIGSDARLRIESETKCIRLGATANPWRRPSALFDYVDVEDHQIVFSPNGKSLFMTTGATSMHGQFRAYDTESGRERWSIRAEGRSGGGAYVMPHSDLVLFQGYQHPDLIRYRASTGERMHNGFAPRLGYAMSFTGAMHEVRDSTGDRATNLYRPIGGKGGSRIAMSTYIGSKCHLSIWDMRNPRGVMDLGTDCLDRHKASSPDERWIAASEVSGKVRMFSWRDGTSHLLDTSHSEAITSIVFTPASDRVISAAKDGLILMADAKNGKLAGRAKLELDYATGLWVSPDGRELVADTARGMRVKFRIGLATQAP